MAEIVSVPFSVGDSVRWSSQAAGFHKIKQGVVAQVLQPGQRPDQERFERLHRSIGCGFGRKGISYVVLVGKKPYWPVASLLKRAEQPEAAK